MLIYTLAPRRATSVADSAFRASHNIGTAVIFAILLHGWTHTVVNSACQAGRIYIYIFERTLESGGVAKSWCSTNSLPSKRCAPKLSYALRFIIRDPNPGGRVTCHTGDFRADSSVCTNPIIKSLRGRLDSLYLDTTYCGPRHAFPEQQEASGCRPTGRGQVGGYCQGRKIACGPIVGSDSLAKSG